MNKKVLAAILRVANFSTTFGAAEGEGIYIGASTHYSPAFGAVGQSQQEMEDAINALSTSCADLKIVLSVAEKSNLESTRLKDELFLETMKLRLLGTELAYAHYGFKGERLVAVSKLLKGLTTNAKELIEKVVTMNLTAAEMNEISRLPAVDLLHKTSELSPSSAVDKCNIC